MGGGQDSPGAGVRISCFGKIRWPCRPAGAPPIGPKFPRLTPDTFFHRSPFAVRHEDGDDHPFDVSLLHGSRKTLAYRASTFRQGIGKASRSARPPNLRRGIFPQHHHLHDQTTEVPSPLAAFLVRRSKTPGSLREGSRKPSPLALLSAKRIILKPAASASSRRPVS